MRIVAFDSVGGAAGDMVLAALIDVGVDIAELERELSGLDVGKFRLRAERGVSTHMAGLRIHIETCETSGPGHSFAAHPPNRIAHRGLAEIEAMIERAGLPAAVRGQSIRIFRRIADVEARIHNIPVEEVHFHEIGALDSIIDVVGSCLALYRLGADAVVVGPLPQGRGSIVCEHGVFPNPAPATLELLRGMQIDQTDLPYELVTPTGAALLSEWRSMARVPAGATVARVGYGLGHRDLGTRPNLLRATLLETAEAANSDECLVLETNLDDVTPELVGVLSQRLLEAGALDVFTLPAQMKKQRPGILLTVLCRFEHRDSMLDLIFRESTTLGVREYPVKRTTLARRSVAVQTPFGEVTVKIGEWKGEPLVRAPEIEDCIQLARRHGVAVRAVYEAAQQAARL